MDDELSDEEEVELPVRRSSIWFQEERGGLYDVPADGTVNPLREGDLKSDDDDDDEAARPPVTESHAIKLAEADVSMEEGPISHEEAAAIEAEVQMEEGPISHEEEISPELVEKGIRIL